MSRGAQLAASAFLAVFGIALAAAALEVGVRVLHLVPDRFWQHDPVLGTRLIPNAEGWWTQEEHEFRVPVRINSLGLRDVEHPLEKPAGVERVLLIGDSHVEALQVPLEQAIGRRLETRLREDSAAAADGGGKRVEVISAGVSGYGTAAEYLLFREVGVELRPDLVLLAFYPGNDVKNNSPVLETALTPEYDADGTPLRIDSGKPRRSRRSLLSRSAAYTYVRKLILTRQPALAHWLVDLGLMKKAALRPEQAPQGVPLDYWVYADPPPPEWADAWARTEVVLDRFRDLVTASGARFAVMIVTSRDHLYPSSWASLEEAYPRLKSGLWNLEGPTQRVLDWCQSRNVACLNLLPIFQVDRDGGGERLHYVHDGHWTAAGHDLAARAATQFILRESLL